MDKLLQWSIAQQSGDKEAISKVGQPDAKILQQLFGGPDEPTLMKQAILVLENDEATEEDKEIAFENFEMLIESLDNANNIENLKLWPAIIDQLSSSIPETRRAFAASCIGIAVQNNPKSQQDFLKHERGLASLIDMSFGQTSEQLKVKSLFAMSSLIRNCGTAYKKFDELGGWKVIDLNSATPDKLKLRSLSLVSAILSTGIDSKMEGLISEHKLVESLIETIDKDTHIGCLEKALNIIVQLVEHKYVLSESQVKELGKGLERIESIKHELSLDDYEGVKKIYTSSVNK